MPTALPSRSAPQTYRRSRVLTWPQTIRFFWLFASVIILDFRLHRAHRRVDRLGLDAAGDELLRLARLWLTTHAAIAALLGIPEVPEAAQVRATLRPLDEIMRHAAAVPPPLRFNLRTIELSSHCVARLDVDARLS